MLSSLKFYWARFFVLTLLIIPSTIPLIRLYPDDPTLTFDYHIDLAKAMLDKGIVNTPHFLYQALIILFYRLFPWLGFDIIGFFIIPILSYLSLAYILQKRFVKELDINGQEKWILFIILALLIIAPISFFSYPRLYLGYIGITMHHSATTLLAKVLSIPIFFRVIDIFKQSEGNKKPILNILCLGILNITCILAKPNYLICLIPALMLMTVYKLWKKEWIDWSLLILGFLIPSFFVLLWQLDFTYVNPSDNLAVIMGKSEIIFAPMLVVKHFTDTPFSDFILSILFPLYIYISYYKLTTRSIEINLAWLTFWFGAFYMYFLAESGDYRTYAANFFWSGQLSLFILFLVSTLFFLKQFDLETELLLYRRRFLKKLDKKAGFGALIFLLHFIGGLIYLIHVSYTKWL